MFNPEKHYLVLTKNFVQAVCDITGRRLSHEAVRAACVSELKESAVWLKSPNYNGVAYIVPAVIFGTEIDLRINFPVDDRGAPKKAPDGKKTMVYAHRAYQPRHPRVA